MPYPNDLLFYTKYNTTLTADFSRFGTATPQSFAYVSIQAANPKLGIGSARMNEVGQPGYIRYSGGGEMVQTGTIAFWVRHDYWIGAQARYFVSIYPTSGTNNFIDIYRTTTGILRVIINDNAGAQILQMDRSWWPGGNIWYHIELNFDLTIGETRVFIDGEQQGATDTSTGTRAAITNYLTLMNNNNFSYLSIRGNIDDVQIYNAVRHTINFTPSTSELSESAAKLVFGYPFSFPHTGFGR